MLTVRNFLWRRVLDGATDEYCAVASGHRDAIRALGGRLGLNLVRTGDGWQSADGMQSLIADEVDLEWSPITNLFPIRTLIASRLRHVELTTAWVRLPDIQIEQSRQRYERMDASTTRYVNLDSGYSALIHHDNDGFPITYEGVWNARAHQGA